MVHLSVHSTPWPGHDAPHYVGRSDKTCCVELCCREPLALLLHADLLLRLTIFFAILSFITSHKKCSAVGCCHCRVVEKLCLPHYFVCVAARCSHVASLGYAQQQCNINRWWNKNAD